MKETLFVSFSGGRTSAYMCWYLLKYWSHKYNFIFVFANTGAEHEKTLIFVNRCDKEFGLNLVWLEAVINPEHMKGTTHKIVTYETATRSLALFDDLCAVYGIPNAAYLHCTRELKTQAIKHYKTTVLDSKLNDWPSNDPVMCKRDHLCAIGYRADEIDRMSPTAEKDGLCYPLISWQHTTKPEILDWWSRQSFDLELEGEHHGNCHRFPCHKKSNRKLYTLQAEDVSLFDGPAELEAKYGHVKAPDKDRVIWRGNRSTAQLLADGKKPFKTYVDSPPELQLRLITDGAFEVDPDDAEGDCGSSSCEAF